jgi:hypothetical protein
MRFDANNYSIAGFNLTRRRLRVRQGLACRTENLNRDLWRRQIGFLSCGIPRTCSLRWARAAPIAARTPQAVPLASRTITKLPRDTHRVEFNRGIDLKSSSLISDDRDPRWRAFEVNLPKAKSIAAT